MLYMLLLNNKFKVFKKIEYKLKTNIKTNYNQSAICHA